MRNQAAAPLNYFLHAYGPAVQPTMVLGWVFSAIAALVCLIIAALLVAGILRRRPSVPANSIGQENTGLQWITTGTAITVCVLLGMAVYMLWALSAVSQPPTPPALTIRVTAYDWWWKADYGDFVTANEIHIPVGVPVLIELQSADVIHAFWVPQLAGKTETIPGLTNRQWLEADQPGIYRGQCTQFCGAQHAHMAFEVVAQSPDDFHAWEEAQRRPAAAPVGIAAEAGQQFFMKNCAGCHAVRGTEAAGGHAPDLTHLGSRRLIAAGLLPNTPDYLLDWVTHVHDFKPGALMPAFPLSPRSAATLSAYLATLK